MLKRRPRSKTRLSKSILDKVDKTEQFSADQLYTPVKAKPSDFSLLVEEAEGVLSQENEETKGGDGKGKGAFILYGLIALILVSIGVIVMLLLKGGT